MTLCAYLLNMIFELFVEQMRDILSAVNVERISNWGDLWDNIFATYTGKYPCLRLCAL